VALMLFSIANAQEEIADSIRIHAEKGMELVGQEEYHKAIDEFKTFIKSVPDDPGILFYTGLCYGKLGEYQKAISYFEKTTKIMPGASQAYVNWGGCLTKIYIESKDPKVLDDAISLYQRAITANANMADAYYNLSSALIHKWRETDDVSFVEESRERILKAIEIIPDVGHYHYNLACVEALLGNVSEMLSSLQKALEYDPSLKIIAREDKDFSGYYDHSDFIELTSD